MDDFKCTPASHALPQEAGAKPSCASTDESRGGSAWNTLAGSVMVVMAAAVVQRTVGFVRSAWFCRRLDPQELGLWDASFGFLMTAGPLIVLALAGSLGRYAEHYRKRGRLRTFVRRTASAYAILAVLGSGAVFLAATPLARLLFNDPDRAGTVRLLAGVLLAVAAFNFLYELMTALRRTAWIAGLQLANSLLFAGIAAGLLLAWQNAAVSVMLAYGIACALTAAAALWGLRGNRFADSPGTASLGHREFWSKILLFSVAIWATSTVSNLFETADRYMILHLLPEGPAAALARLGDYHAARLVPTLMVSLAAMTAAIAVPHLSREWESGNREAVGLQVRLLLKLFGGMLCLGSAVFLAAAPWVFHVLFAGKYPAGLEILPLTIASCLWYALFLILQNYLICWERALLAGAALAAGLVVNMVLNAVLLPVFGLPGAVAATAAANLTALLLLAGICRRLGWRLDRGIAVVLALPLLAPAGPLAFTAGLAAAAVWAWHGRTLFRPEEKRIIADYCNRLRMRRPFRDHGRPKTAAAGELAASHPASLPALETGPPTAERSDASVAIPVGAGPRFAAETADCSEMPFHSRYERERMSIAGLPLSHAPTSPFCRRRVHTPLGSREPLRVMFVITCMPVGGAETLLVEIVRRMDRRLLAPELCCLKYPGPLGEILAREVPTFSGLLAHKYDFRVLPRLTRLMRQRRIDAVITVGTGGDKMFWGRLAAYLAGVPVIASALHSTGLPDRVEFLNRLLSPITDAFIAVAENHGRYLAEQEGCPPSRVQVVVNGVDTTRFRPIPPDRALRRSLGAGDDERVVAIVAALRPEKNHELFLRAAVRVHAQDRAARFWIIGDGPRREVLERLSVTLLPPGIVRFLGTRGDIPELLACADVVALSSHMEANPLSILEAMACGKPVVATRVGSVPENVIDGVHGFLVPPGDAEALADRCLELLRNPRLAHVMGLAGHQRVALRADIERTVRGYEDLILRIYAAKCGGNVPNRPALGLQPPLTMGAREGIGPGLAKPAVAGSAAQGSVGTGSVGAVVPLGGEGDPSLDVTPAAV
ncbi:MAG: glycosyltransferase [Thermogutta sp.]